MQPRPIALSDEDMDHVYAACRPLAPARRDDFLRALAEELRGKPVGPGSVGRAIRELQREFFDPPQTGLTMRPATRWSR
jgi:hypothetical protein